MQRVFKTKFFHRWMKKTTLTDEALCQAVNEMTQGLVDASLGGGLFKKRVAIPGQGKRGSVRTLIATNLGASWFFVYGFSKNQRASINQKETLLLQKLATDLLERTDKQLDQLTQKGELQEICYEQH